MMYLGEKDTNYTMRIWEEWVHLRKNAGHCMLAVWVNTTT